MKTVSSTGSCMDFDQGVGLATGRGGGPLWLWPLGEGKETLASDGSHRWRQVVGRREGVPSQQPAAARDPSSASSF